MNDFFLDYKYVGRLKIGRVVLLWNNSEINVYEIFGKYFFLIKKIGFGLDGL